jgi:hypothetical protein
MRTTLTTLVAVVIAGAFAAVPAAAQPAPPLAPMPAEFLEAYRAQCGSDIPSFVSSDGEGIRISLDTRGELAVLGVCIDEHKVAVTREIVSLDEALAFMALREAETLWPQAEAKWGNDMAQLRADLRALAMTTKDETEIGRLMDGKTDVIRARAFALAGIGYFDEALGLLDEELARISTERMMRRRGRDFERVMTGIGTTSVMAQYRGDAAGAASLKAFLDRVPSENRFVINVEINLAAHLVESGQYREALDLLKPAYAKFRALQDGTKSYKIGGSDREFAWILACAHHGLNNAEASYYMGIVNSAEEMPQDQHLDTTKRSSFIKLRMAACMNDQDTYFDLMFSTAFGPLSGIWGAVQSPRKSDEFFLRKDWDVPPAVTAKYLERYRILPDSYAAALNRWQAGEPLRNRLQPIVD